MEGSTYRAIQANALGRLSLMETRLVRNTRTKPDSICSECRYRVPAVISDRMRVDNEGNGRRANSCIHQLLRELPICVLPSVSLWSTSYNQVGSCQTVLHPDKTVSLRSTRVFGLTNHSSINCVNFVCMLNFKQLLCWSKENGSEY